MERQEISDQLDLWKNTALKFFNNEIKGVEVTDRAQIIQILNTLGTSKVMNHTFMPSGGGLDLAGAKYSYENGLIEINFDGSAKIVKPVSLTFHPISDNPEWWYYRLNTAPFTPSGVYEDDAFKDHDELKYYGEELVEVSPGNYIERAYWDMNYLGHDENGREIPLPGEARLVNRANNGGAYVIFPKFSSYNHNPRTYDGRHNKMSGKEFEQYITDIVNHLKDKE